MADDKISDNEAIDAALHLDGDPRRVRRYYEEWARDYDVDVAGAGYRGPEISARLLRQFRADTAIRVLDAGCGTGLVGIELGKLGYAGLDGFDLSESMAEQARANDCYNEVRGGVDMMQASRAYDGQEYDAVLSIGVFTLGHVPPQALLELLALTRAGGLLLVSTRTRYYDETDFRQMLERLSRERRIRILQQMMDAPYNHDGDGHYWVLEKSA